MAANDDFAITGATGAAAVAPTGTVGPTSMAALNVAFKDLGWISDDGLVEAFNENRTNFIPWGSNSPIKSVVTSTEKTFQVTFWESNADVLGLYFKLGAAPTPDATSHIISVAEAAKPDPDPRSFVFDILEGTNHVRLYVPKCEVTDRGNLVYKSDAIIGYPVTMTAYAGSDGFTCQRLYLLDAIVSP
jgi:hypothetical protein